MADAGSEYYHAISGAGANIGKAIQQFAQRHQKQKSDITRDMAVLDRLAQMPDPTDPTGKKMLVDPKKMIALRHLKGAQLQAAAEGEIGAIELGQKIHKAGEPIRNLMSGPKTQTDETGRQWRFNGREWIPMSPQKSQQNQKSAGADQPTKKLNASLAPYGLTQDDLSRVQMEHLDSGGNVIQPQGTSPIDITGAKHVRLKTESGKQATIPIGKWQQIDDAYRNIHSDTKAEQGTADQIKADYHAGKISRDDALERLRALKMFGVADTKESPNGASDDESDTEE